MIRRIAATTSLVVFTVCLLAGLEAGNTFGTTVWRALVAMVATLVVGAILGAMAQKMLEENLRGLTSQEKNEAKTGAADR